MLSFAVASGASAAPPVVGTLTQLSGTAGCLSLDGSSQAGAGTCGVAAHGVNLSDSVIVSPDGRFVYVTTYLGELGVFSRDTTTGALTQLPGASGCFADTASPCTEARGIAFGEFGDGRDMAITSDGLWLYTVSQGNPPGTVMIFRRNPTSGTLTQLTGTAGCISSDGSSQDGAGTCQSDATLNEPNGVSLSPDDNFLYVTDYGTPKRVHVFSRNASTGALTDVQCLAVTPAPPGCTPGRVLGNSQSLVISADGMHAYGAHYQYGLSVFDRNPVTGILTQKIGTAGCITDSGNDDAGMSTCAVGRVMHGDYALTLAPNGQTLYVSAGSPGYGVAIFHVNSDGTLSQLAGAAGCITQNGNDELGNPTCASGRDLNGGPYGSAISPDGRTLYLSNDGKTPGGVDTFAVDPTTGALTQFPGTAGCTTTDGSSDGTLATAGQCATGRLLADAYGLAVSPDGASVYVPGDRAAPNGGLAIFTRQAAPLCQAASATATAHAPATIALHCASPNGEPVTVAIASGPSHGTLSALSATAGTVVYTPKLAYVGPDSFTFYATDGTNVSTAASATLTDTATAPLFIGKVRESAKRLREGKPHSSGTRKLPKSIRFSFMLDQAATVKMVFLVHVAGKRSHGRCVAPTAKNIQARPCTRTVQVGELSFAAKAGANKLAFNGKVSKHHILPPGTYTVELTATNTSRLTSTKRALTFTIVSG